MLESSSIPCSILCDKDSWQVDAMLHFNNDLYHLSSLLHRSYIRSEFGGESTCIKIIRVKKPDAGKHRAVNRDNYGFYVFLL